MPSAHCLKTWPKYFKVIESGEKNFELRKNDRNFEAGDLLKLEEWDPETERYTGNFCLCHITYILQGGQFDLPDSLCILSIQKINL